MGFSCDPERSVTCSLRTTEALRLRAFVFNDLRRHGNQPFEPPYFRSPTTVRFVAQIARLQFMLLRSSRSSGEKWLYRPVSISLSRANGGISRKARIALCTSRRTGGFCRVVECATW